MKSIKLTFLFICTLFFSSFSIAESPEPNMPRIGNEQKPSAMQIVVDGTNSVHPDKGKEEASSDRRDGDYQLPFKTVELNGGASKGNKVNTGTESDSND